MASDDKMTVASVLEEASRNTGLTNLGDEHFLVPLRILLDGFRHHPTPSPAVLVLARGTLVHAVENRLRLQAALERDPSIPERPVRRPLFVVGLPRTGTTFLHDLLAQDPESRTLRLHETLTPVPLPGEDEDRRVERARLLASMAGRFAPALASAHRLDPRAPEECLGLLQTTFVTPFMVPFFEGGQLQYRAWLETLGAEARDRSYREYRWQLQVLQGDEVPRWTLKCPCHMFGLPSLLRVFPDAEVVQTHRELTAVIPSLASLQAMFHEKAPGALDRHRTGASTVELVERLLRWGMAARKGENEGRILDVDFRDLVSDPVGTVGRIYRRWGRPMTGALRRRLETQVAERPRNRPGEHRYTLEEYGLDRARILERFAWYEERFGIREAAAGARGPTP